VEMFSLPRGAK